MTADLGDLLRLAARVPECPACRWDQAVSFVFGNLACTTNHRVDRRVVTEAVERVRGPRPHPAPECARCPAR